MNSDQSNPITISKKNICINYFGQCRDIKTTEQIYNEFIKTNDPNIEYTILYTTWKDEDTTEFANLFPNAYIKKYDYPDLNDYKNIINNYSMDPTNVANKKTLIYYLLGLYIKKMSYYTIEDVSHMKFDCIVSLRTYIYIYDLHLSTIYNNIEKETVYVANSPKYDIYLRIGQPALPDVIFISDKNTMKYILHQIDIIGNCNVKNTNAFHPESSFYNSLAFFNLKIMCCNFRAFSQPLYE